MLLRLLSRAPQISIKNGLKNFMTSISIQAESKNVNISGKKESTRMKVFHEKLRADRLPPVGQTMRLVDLVLVETDPESGDLIPNSEKQPTKWGDWQQGGRVTDF